MSILPKEIYRFNAIPHQNSSEISHRNRKSNPKIHMKIQKTTNSHKILSKNSNAEVIVILHFKLCYRNIITTV
jgi:hypothetical protein